MSGSGQVTFAVVIACRNALEGLRQTLSSVTRLNDARVRTIVIDGASSDGTAEFLAQCPHRLSHFCSEPDSGIYDAMNKGWRAAPEDAYILFLGAGDLLISLPQDGELHAANGAPLAAAIGHVSIGRQAFRSRWTAELRLRNTAHHQALLLRKSVAPEPPFDTSLRVYADWDLNLRLLGNGIRAQAIDGLTTYAEPGGVSWHHDLGEIRRVASRHSGLLVGWLAWMLNAYSLRRRRRGGN